MKSAVETLSPTRVRVSVEVPFDEVQPSVDAAYKKIAQQITIPGFRKGKVPARIIDQRVGRGAVLDEAVNDVLPRAYGDALTENDIKVLGQPDVEVTDFADGADLKFTAEVDIRPEIELPDFATLTVSVDDAVVADEDIDAQIESLRSRFATVKAVERPVAEGDVVTIDLTGEIAEEAVDELTGKGMSYEVGSGNLLENLDDALVGLSEGEEGQFTFRPEGGDFADQDVQMRVVVTGVKERELPELDDDFASTVSEFDTIDELRSQLRDELLPRKQVEQLVAARDAVLAELLQAVEVPVPEGVIANALADHFQDGHGDDSHKSEYETTVRESLTRDLVLDTIADRESVEVTQNELTEYLVRQAPQYGMTPDQFVQALSESGQAGAIFGEVRRAKALSLVLEAASVTDASGNVVDMTPQADESAPNESAEPEAPEAPEVPEVQEAQEAREAGANDDEPAAADPVAPKD